MAVIKQYDSWFGEIRWRVKVKYSTRTRRFSIDLPKAAHESLGKEVTAETEQEVEREYKKKGVIFKNSSCEKSQVILLRLETNEDDEGKGYSSNFDAGIKLILHCGVFEKRTWDKSDKHRNVTYEELDSIIPEDAQFHDQLTHWDIKLCTELEWSQELEDKVAKLVKVFILLKDKLTAICSTPEKLIEALSGNLLLLGDGKV